MFITWVEGETQEKEFDAKGHFRLDNPAESVMACGDFVLYLSLVRLQTMM